MATTRSFRGSSKLRLVIMFSMAFSISSLAGVSAQSFQFPSLQLGNADPQPCQTHQGSGNLACSEYWNPAGPAMNYMLTPIFTDAASELANIQAGSPTIDLTDVPIPSGLSFLGSQFLTSDRAANSGYAELEFMLHNNFWGCNFSFGNSTCGVQIRQGIAHMFDKTQFTMNEGDCASICSPIDNPASSINSRVSLNKEVLALLL